jgi:hypothetical protein
MLIIDITNQRVNNVTTIDPDVVVVKGASDELISSLSKLVQSTKVPLSNRKYVEQFSKEVPASVKASGGGVSFDEAYDQITKAVNKAKVPIMNRPVKAAKPVKAKKLEPIIDKAERKAEILDRLANFLVEQDEFVAAIQTAVQESEYFNPEDKLFTLTNAQTAIILCAQYDPEDLFSSVEGVFKINGLINVSSSIIARLATDFKVLDKTGVLAATKYSVSDEFETLVVNIIQSGDFELIDGTVQDILDEIAELNEE